VVGIDASADVVAKAEGLRRERGVANVEFRVGDVYHLELAPESFDVAHAHQVLQHLADPVAALASMRAALVPGGVVAVRDGDYGGFVWGPDSDALERWMELYHQVTARNGGEADAGRYLLGWVQRAGFVDAVATSSTWTFADPATRAWWAGTWAERVEHSAFADQAVDYGLADRAELRTLAEGWRRWAQEPDGFFAVLHAEVVARRPANGEAIG
jgi:SAM-dependent methyltransferase